jgi:hypothetical protein
MKVNDLLANLLVLCLLCLQSANAQQSIGKPSPAANANRRVTSPFLSLGQPRQRKPILSSSYVDIDGDGKREQVDIRLISGKLLEAEEESCLGFRKYEGKFSIAVWVAGRPIEQSLNALWGNEREEMFFHAKPFRLGFHDYNHDGQPDFNIGQYENCNGWRYKLFTIARDGNVTLMKVEGFDAGLYLQAFDNSTTLIKESDSGFSKKEYSNGDDSCMPCVKVFVWNQQKQVFTFVRKIPAKD